MPVTRAIVHSEAVPSSLPLPAATSFSWLILFVLAILTPICLMALSILSGVITRYRNPEDLSATPNVEYHLDTPLRLLSIILSLKLADLPILGWLISPNGLVRHLKTVEEAVRLPRGSLQYAFLNCCFFFFPDLLRLLLFVFFPN
jgi:hypothetical protein